MIEYTPAPSQSLLLLAGSAFQAFFEAIHSFLASFNLFTNHFVLDSSSMCIMMRAVFRLALLVSAYVHKHTHKMCDIGF